MVLSAVSITNVCAPDFAKTSYVIDCVDGNSHITIITDVCNFSFLVRLMVWEELF